MTGLFVIANVQILGNVPVHFVFNVLNVVKYTIFVNLTDAGDILLVTCIVQESATIQNLVEGRIAALWGPQTKQDFATLRNVLTHWHCVQEAREFRIKSYQRSNVVVMGHV